MRDEVDSLSIEKKTSEGYQNSMRVGPWLQVPSHEVAEKPLQAFACMGSSISSINECLICIIYPRLPGGTIHDCAKPIATRHSFLSAFQDVGERSQVAMRDTQIFREQ